MILVTGATGFIGRSLMRVLGEQARPYTGRINNPMALRAQLEGVETVFHLAGAESRGRVSLLEHVDVEGCQRLLEECRRANVQRLVVMSRIGADSNFIYPLLRAKGEVERAVRQANVPYTIVRSATLFGRQDRFTNVIARLSAWSWPIVWLPGGGQVVLQPLWVEDLVRCLVAIPSRPELTNKTITLAGEEQRHYADIVRLVLDTTGRSRPIQPLDIRLIRPLARFLFGWQRRPLITRFALDQFSIPETAGLNSLLQQFGFRPGRIQDHIAYLRSRPKQW